MSAYKALITDLDGTVVKIASDGSEISDKTRQAVRRAQQKGYKLTCATGRHWESAKPVVERLGLLSPCVVEGGTRIVDPRTDETLWEKALDRHSSTRIFNLLKQRSSGGLLMTSEDDVPRELHTVTSVSPELRLVYLLALEVPLATQISAEINSQDFAVAHLTPSWQGPDLLDIHITHPQATKEHAIQIWQTMEHVARSETIGLGDSSNDIPLFMSAGLKVAVDNATDDLKKLADHVVPGRYGEALRQVIGFLGRNSA